MRIERLQLPKLSPFATDDSRQKLRRFVPLQDAHNEAAREAQNLLAKVQAGGYMNAQTRKDLREVAQRLAETGRDIAALQHTVDSLDPRDVERGFRADDVRRTAMGAAKALESLANGLDKHAETVSKLEQRAQILASNKLEGRPWHSGLAAHLMLGRDIDALTPEQRVQVFGRHWQVDVARIRAMDTYHQPEVSVGKFDVEEHVNRAMDEASAFAEKVPNIGRNYYEDGNARQNASMAAAIDGAIETTRGLLGRGEGREGGDDVQ